MNTLTSLIAATAIGSILATQVGVFDDVMEQVNNIDNLMAAGVKEAIKIAPEFRHLIPEGQIY